MSGTRFRWLVGVIFGAASLNTFDFAPRGSEIEVVAALQLATFRDWDQKNNDQQPKCPDMYRRFPGATQPSVQVDEQNNFSMNTDASDNWNDFSPSYTQRYDVPQNYEQATQAPTPEKSPAGGASGGISTEQVTSPPLSSFSVLLKDGDGLGEGLNIGSLPGGRVIPSLDLDAALTNRAAQDAMELISFKMSQQKMVTALPSEAATLSVDQLEDTEPIPIKPSSLACQSVWSSDDDVAVPFSEASMLNRNTVPSSPLEHDRGYRKKSREKMRRQEVNVKFEVLVDLLGLAGRVRKKNILHEAATAIKGLKRECIQLRRDRDCLQQEVNKLATYLQNSDRHSLVMP